MTTLLIALLTASASAADLQLVHSGHLADAAGEPPGEQYDITVRLLTEPGDVVWERTFDDVALADGFFSVTLGTDPTGNTIESALFSATPAVSIETTATGPGGSVSLGSQPLLAVPESARTHGVQVLNGIAGTSCTGDGGLAFDSATAKLTVCSAGTWTAIQ